MQEILANNIMEKILLALFDLKRIPTKLILVFWLSCVLILFAPEKFLNRLNINDFMRANGKYIGVCFVLSSAFLVVVFISFLSKSIGKRKMVEKRKKEITRDLNSLDNHEKALLREFYIHGKDTLQLPMDNETVVGLANKGIIYQASSTGFTYVHGAYFPYSITEFASKNLNAQKIDLPENPTEGEKSKILNARPNWAKERQRFDDRLSSRWW
jgi:Super-infection exclusion protein B